MAHHSSINVNVWILAWLTLAILPKPIPAPAPRHSALVRHGTTNSSIPNRRLQKIDSRKVCYDYVGCFTDDPPFTNALDFLPSAPEVLDLEFRLYTNGIKDFVDLDWHDPWTHAAEPLNPRLPTKFIIHGFGNELDASPWIHQMTHTFLKHGNYNIIEVGWNTQFPDYFQAVADTRVVGRVTAILLKFLTWRGLDLSKVHLIGHSLGAHIAGYVSDQLGFKVARISGLDPAGPLFASYPPEVRLDPTDAQFVDVIHTNGHSFNLLDGGGFGTMLECGHLDFYANGGVRQPGCLDGVAGGIEKFFEDIFAHHLDNITHEVLEAIQCSHGRAHDIFIESIGASSCLFKSFPCTNYDDFEAGKCTQCGADGCNVAGLDASQTIAGRVQYFDTLAVEPLCGYPYVITITSDNDTYSLAGTITATFNATAGVKKVDILDGNLTLSQKTPFQRTVVLDKDLGNVNHVKLHFHREDWVDRRNFTLEALTLETFDNGPRFKTLPPAFTVSVYQDANKNMTRT